MISRIEGIGNNMAILKRMKQKPESNGLIYSEIDTRNYYIMHKWLAVIYKVEDIDTKKIYTLDCECKAVYSYLVNFGKAYGYNSIYPNQELISNELCIPLTTLKRKIKTLGLVGLVDIIKMKDKSKFTSNQYKVNRPNLLSRRKWFDMCGVEISGKFYKFDYKVFK